MSAWAWGKHPVTLRESLILDKSRSAFFGDRKSVPLLVGPHPCPAGLIASAAGQGGCPALAAAGQGSQPSACLLPLAQPFPGFPAPSLVIVAYLLSCHCWVRWTSGRGAPVTTFPSSPRARWSPSLQVPACPLKSRGSSRPH